MIYGGDYSYISSRIIPKDNSLYILNSEYQDVTIGKFCSFADSVTIFAGGEHNTDWITTYPLSEIIENRKCDGHPKTRGPVVIGNDVWVGSQAVIMSGVTIGDGACVGTRSVVTKDVAPYTIVAGNPARFIRKRFEDHIINELLNIKWWDWPLDKIKEAIPLLQSDNIWEFIRYARNIISADAVFQEQIPAMSRVLDS